MAEKIFGMALVMLLTVMILFELGAGLAITHLDNPFVECVACDRFERDLKH